jgi:hypothetical protein
MSWLLPGDMTSVSRPARRYTIVAAIGGTLGAAIALGIALTEPDGSVPFRDLAAPATHRVVVPPKPSSVRLRTLERPPKPSDKLPPALSASLSKVGATPEVARRALAKGGRTFYLVPAYDGVCVAMVSEPEGGQGFVCHTGQQWDRGSGGPGKIFTGCSSDFSRPCDFVTLFDAVPDGVRTVSIERRSRPPLLLRVRRSVYLLRATAHPGSVSTPTYVTYERPRRSPIRQRIYSVP